MHATVIKMLVQYRKPIAKLAGELTTKAIKHVCECVCEKYQQKKARELKEVR